MQSINWNAIRTWLLASGVFAFVVPPVVNFVLTLLGCTGDNPATPDVTEVAACSGGSLIAIPEWLQMTVGTIVFGALGLLKAFTGTGTVKQNLLNQQAPIVKKPEEAKAGVVTPAQVESPK